MPNKRQKKSGGTGVVSNAPSNNKSSVVNGIKNTTNGIKSKVNGITNSIGAKVNEVKDRAEKLKNNVGSKISEAKEKATSAKNSLSNRVQGSELFGKTQNQLSGLGSFAGEFAEKNSVIAKIIFVVFVFVIFGLLLRLGIYLLSLFYVADKNPIVVNGMRPLRNSKVYQVNPNASNPKPILRSINENQGMEFTWSTWIWLNGGVSSDSNEPQFIFSKGQDSVANNQVMSSNTTMNSPGLYLDNANDSHGNKRDNNTLKVVVSLFGLDSDEYDNDGKATESIFIQNIPMQKWVNVIIRVQGKILDVYINGTLTKRKEFDRVVKQNYGNVHVGSQKYGADGYVSSLRYYDHAIGNYTIQDIMYKGPNLKMEGSEMTTTAPPYLGMKWYLNDP
jgi:uncharacterized protein YoxC